MTQKPPLPDGYQLPATINGWQHDPESNKNGHIWVGPDRESSVGVFGSVGKVRVKALDDRVHGFGNYVTVWEAEYDHDGDTIQPADPDAPDSTVVDGVEAAVEWMDSTDPGAWAHPDVCEAVFDDPPGYSLDRYYREERATTIYYRRDGAEGGVRLAGGGEPEEYTPETCPYLYVHCWHGSGDATVAIAPWLRAHGPSSKYPEISEVADPPADCGLEIALKYAREWAADQTGEPLDPPAAGQSGLTDWGADA